MICNRRGLLKAIAFCLALSPALSFAQDPVALKLSHWLPAQHPMSVYMQKWADDLTTQSDGRLKINVFPAGQLGNVTKHYDMVRRGVADIGFILHGTTSDRFPLTSLIDLPFMFTSAVHGTKILNSPEIRRYLDPEHRGLKVLYLLTHQPGQIITADKPIRKPEDLKGLRIRFPSATTKAYLEKLGASVVGLPPSAIAENIQKKVIDGLMIDYGGAGIAYRLGGSVGHVLELSSYATTFGLVMNPDTYNGLPADLKKLIDASVTDQEVAIGRNWDMLNEPGKKALMDGGAKIHVPTAQEMGPFVTAGKALAEEILTSREAENPDARKVYELMRQASVTYADK